MLYWGHLLSRCSSTFNAQSYETGLLTGGTAILINTGSAWNMCIAMV